MKSTEDNKLQIELDLREKEINRLIDLVDSLNMELSRNRTEPRHNFSNMLMDMFDLDPSQFDPSNPSKIISHIKGELSYSIGAIEAYKEVVKEMLKRDRNEY